MTDPRHVLVVDDNELVRETLHENLTDAGCRVSVAPDGATALTLIGSEDVFDAAVLDLLLAEEMGVDLADYISALGVPCVLISGDRDSIDRAMKYGHRVIAKPFHTSQLLGAIETAIAARVKA